MIEKAFYRIPEVEPIIGFGRSMIYKFIREGKLTAINVEGSVRIPAEALQEWIQRHKATSTAAAERRKSR